MNIINEILPFVEKPSRYLGSELNSVHKAASDVDLRFLLAFPDTYEIGTSHFGIQILYNILNGMERVAAERVFTPDVDLDALLRAKNAPLFALESHDPASSFHIIGFSLLYELNYTNVLAMLDLAGIPFLAKDRSDGHPLIIAGGPCMCNPQPVADFFDAIVIGDGEAIVAEMAAAYLSGGDKQAILQKWSKLDGVYVPSLNNKPKRRILADLNQGAFPTRPVIPFSKPIHDRLRIEIARGCASGCRFCQAGVIYRPVRERSPQEILRLTDDALANTGYDDISMLSLSTGDYSCLMPLMRAMMTRWAKDNVAVSLPSLRAGSLTPELIELVKTVRKTGFTIAPEAGSQRLRDVINKNITEAQIFSAVENAFMAGWQNIKLYFMLGLPTETQADLDAMVDLVLRLRKLPCFSKRANLSVSIGLFVPKPWTPFQWEPMLDPDEAFDRMRQLKERMMRPGIQIKWQDTRVSLVEGVWSRGDSSLSRALIRAYELGCRFDGWSDHFNFDKWMQAFSDTNIDVARFTTNPPSLGNPLPWDKIDMGVSREFLLAEHAHALAEKLTPPCREACSNCGVCNFSTIKPMWEHAALTPEENLATERYDDFIKVQAYFEKTGKARFFGHLEMMDIILRALKRSKISVAFSAGFHPKPKISFGDTLPLGMESLHEVFNLQVARRDFAGFVARLNASLPEGLKVKDAVDVSNLTRRDIAVDNTENAYEVHLLEGKFDAAQLANFMAKDTFAITWERKPGEVKSLDMRAYVLKAELASPTKLSITIGRDAKNNTVRPHLVLRFVFGLNEQAVQKARVIKIS